MTTKRKIISASAPVIGGIQEKHATGFIDDVSFGSVFSPIFERITDNDAWQIFMINDWVGNTVNRIVKDSIKNRIVIAPIDKSKSVKKGSRISQRIASANRFFFDPNDNKESMISLREKALRDLLIYGRGAYEKNVNEDTREIEELWAIQARDIRVNSDAHGNIPTDKAYKLIPSRNKTANRNPVFFDIDEIIFMVLNPVSNSSYGIKPLDILAFTASVEILRNTWNGNNFINGAMPAALIGLPDMGKVELRKFRGEWKKFKGARNSQKTAIVNTKIDYQQLSQTNKDMDFTQYGRELRDKIFSAFGMQPAIMGITDASSRLNAPQQLELYKENAIKPILQIEADFYTREILHMGMGFRDLMVEFPSVEVADNLTQSTIDGRNLQNAVVTVNEIRRRNGMTDVPWGDTPVIILPGGGQIDPVTGRLVVGGTAAKTIIITSEDEYSDFNKFIDSTKNQMEAIVEAMDNIAYDKCAIKETIKASVISINGKKYDVKRYTLPTKFKGCQLDILLDRILDTNGSYKNNMDSAGKEYFNCLKSRLKFVVVSNIINGTPNLITEQIDRVKNEEISIGPVKEIFNGKN